MFGVIQSRRNERLPGIGPFWDRDWIPTTTIPQSFEGGGSGIAKQIDLESSMRNGTLRSNTGACDDVRNLEIPLAWQFNYMPHGYQQPTDLGFEGLQFTRQMVADTARPLPQDDPSYYSQPTFAWSRDKSLWRPDTVFKPKTIF